MHTTEASATLYNYHYAFHVLVCILGELVCKEVFLEVNEIGERVYRSLKTVVEGASVQIPKHCSVREESENMFITYRQSL